ncbi:MAG: DUF2829 domain-containing protein [Colwellia sp.]|nr:DUF2829 domain-containing protein [Colwellia sp.]
MNFSDAMVEISRGKKVQRVGWNGKGMFIFSIAGNDWGFITDVGGVDGLDTEPFYCMRTADSKLIPWVTSQADVFAEDWQVVKTNP